MKIRIETLNLLGIYEDFQIRELEILFENLIYYVKNKDEENREELIEECKSEILIMLGI